MVAVFSTPILSVAVDVVRDLEGREALTGLWNIFTKCKGSLQNGSRLENITWRLWHRELKVAELEKKRQREMQESAMSDARVVNEKTTYHPPDPQLLIVNPTQLPNPSEGVTLRSECLPPPSYCPPKLILASRSTPREDGELSSCIKLHSSGTRCSVGQVVCDFIAVTPTSSFGLNGNTELPSEFPAVKNKMPSASSSECITSAILSTDALPKTISLPRVVPSASQNIVSCLPTPEIEVGNLVPPILQFSSPDKTPSSLLAPASSRTDCSLSSPSMASPAISDVPQVLSGQAVPVSSQLLPDSVETFHLALPPSLLPSSQQSSTAKESSQNPTIDSTHLPAVSCLLPEPPKLVIVRPTPNPTPNPTPPTTPLLTNTGGVMGAHRQQLLLPLNSGRSRLAERSVSVERASPSPLTGGDPVEVPVGQTGLVVQDVPVAQVHFNGTHFSDGVVALGPLDRHEGSYDGLEELSRDNADRRSISSVASKSSSYSHTTSQTTISNVSSTAGASTTSASSTSFIEDEVDKMNSLIGAAPGYTHSTGNVSLATLRRLGSLSTIQSISTDRGRKEMITSLDIGNGSGMATAAEDDGFAAGKEEGDPAALSSEAPSISDSQSYSKRNGAPAPLTSQTLTFSPKTTSPLSQCSHHSPHAEEPLSAEHSGVSTSGRNPRATINNHRATGSDQSSSHSRSTGRSTGASSMKRSRSRSHEHSAVPFADLSGLGTLGGYTIAAAYPPPNMTVRKQVVVGAGKPRVRIALGRGLGKGRAIRRNSAGPGVDVGVQEKGKEVDHARSKMERLKSSQSYTGHASVPPHDQSPRAERQVPEVPTLINEKAPQELTSTAPPVQQDSPRMKRLAELLLVGEPVENLKRQARFNIGSNSDDGSGMGSKSAGSGSSVSGGRGISQRFHKMMEGEKGQKRQVGRDAPSRTIVDERQCGALLLQEHARRRRGDDGEAQRSPQVEDVQVEVPTVLPLSRKSTKQEVRHSKRGHHLHQPPLIQGLNSQTGSECVQSAGRVSDKKGKSKAVDHHYAAVLPPAASASKQSSKNKSKSTPNLGVLDPVLAAQVRDSIAEPLLPKGRPVVVDTESDYETDTEDGSWSDEDVIDDTEVQKQEQYKRELAIQQERERQEAERQQQEMLLQQLYLQQQQEQHHQLPARGAGMQRTQSSHYPGAHNARTSKHAAHRARQQQVRELALHHAKLEQAAKEAKRQRDMIKKLPTESFQDLAKARANSVGLLTQLFNPNPEIFSPNHPYRRGYSSGAIQPAALTPMAMQVTTSEPQPSKPVLPAVSQTINTDPPPQPPAADRCRPPLPRRHMSTDEGTRHAPSLSKITSPMRGPLMLTKGSAAGPVSSQVQVGSVNTKAASSVAVVSGALGSNLAMTGSGGYRPKGPPKDQEMEEDSDSEPESGKIQVSKSVAEQKLKALVEKRGIRQHQAVAPVPAQAGPSRLVGQGDEDVPEWARVSQPDQQQQHLQPSLNGLPFTPVSRPPSVPIPFGHPYNLPLPAPPTTPRTTRRQMLSTELSESLRRNLLWERQVSKHNLAAMRRSASGGGSRLGALQPFTAIPRVVQLHAKGTIPPDQQDDRVGVLVTEDEREEMRRHAVARNRSWANEFHYAGW